MQTYDVGGVVLYIGGISQEEWNIMQIVIKENNLKYEKANAKRIAKQLWYYLVMPDVFKKIDNCDNITQITNVLKTCRHMI